MPHRESISNYLRKLSFDNCVIYDWGCGGKPATNYIKITDRVKYFSFDKNPQSKAKWVVDFENDPIPEDLPAAEVAFCIEVLEHTKEPDDVLLIIWNNMVEGGTLYLSVPFLFPVHHEEDYWRFTDIGLKLLLERNFFTIVEIFATEDNAGWFVKAIKNKS